MPRDTCRCGDRLEAAGAVLNGRQIARVLAQLGLPADFLARAPARSPPVALAEDSRGSASGGTDWLPPGDDVQVLGDDKPAASLGANGRARGGGRSFCGGRGLLKNGCSARTHDADRMTLGRGFRQPPAPDRGGG